MAENKMQNYDGVNNSWGTHTIKVLFQVWEYTGSMTYEIGGNRKGLNVLLSQGADILDYLEGIVSGNFADEVKKECIEEGSCVEVNGINFKPVSKIDICNIDGETLVLLYDSSDLVAKIPFYDIISYKIKEVEPSL